jgi:hypothetical protein
MSQHTPGPWAIDAPNGVIRHENGAICDLRYPIYPPEQPDELSANARLIAAAPDLLACVHSFLSNWPQFDAESEDYGIEVSGADLVDWCAEQAWYWKQALNKAQGR